MRECICDRILDCHRDGRPQLKMRDSNYSRRRPSITFNGKKTPDKNSFGIAHIRLLFDLILYMMYFSSPFAYIHYFLPSRRFPRTITKFQNANHIYILSNDKHTSIPHLSGIQLRHRLGDSVNTHREFLNNRSDAMQISETKHLQINPSRRHQTPLNP